MTTLIHIAHLLACAQLESIVHDFLDHRMSGERDLIVRGRGVTLEVFRGDMPVGPRMKTWADWGFAGETVLAAYRDLRVSGVKDRAGFWTAPSLKPFNWHIHESTRA